MSVTALLLGGPKGGEVMVIPGPTPTIKAAVFRPTRWEGSWEASHRDLSPSVRTVDYVREAGHHGKDWAVYRYQPSVQDVLEDAKRLVETVEKYDRLGQLPHSVLTEAQDFRRIHLGGK